MAFWEAPPQTFRAWLQGCQTIRSGSLSVCQFMPKVFDVVDFSALQQASQVLPMLKQGHRKIGSTLTEMSK